MKSQLILCPHKTATENFYKPTHSLDVHIPLIPPDNGEGGCGIVLCYECATMVKGILFERVVKDAIQKTYSEVMKYGR